MKDKNQKKLKIGDWILYDPDHPYENLFRVGKISGMQREDEGTTVALIYYKNDPDPWHRSGIYLEKISNKEAMIYLLEN